MTREQYESLTKKELNVILAQFTGGYTKSNLEKIKKSDIIDQILQFSDAKVNKKKSRSGQRLNKIEILKNTVDKLQKIFGVNPTDVYSHKKLVAFRVQLTQDYPWSAKTLMVLPRNDNTFTCYVGKIKFSVDELSEKSLKDEIKRLEKSLTDES